MRKGRLRELRRCAEGIMLPACPMSFVMLLVGSVPGNGGCVRDDVCCDVVASQKLSLAIAAFEHSYDALHS